MFGEVRHYRPLILLALGRLPAVPGTTDTACLPDIAFSRQGFPPVIAVVGKRFVLATRVVFRRGSGLRADAVYL